MNKLGKSDHVFDLDAEPEPHMDSQEDTGIGSQDLPLSSDDFVLQDDDNDAGMHTPLIYKECLLLAASGKYSIL